MVMQRTDETNPGVCPPLPLTGLRLGRSLKRLGVDCRRHDNVAFNRRRQGISGRQPSADMVPISARTEDRAETNQ